MIRKPYTSDEPEVSVVIPTIPSNDHEEVVAALRTQTATEFEVLVVDDATLDVCEARNAGIDAASADVIALTDDDCRPPPDWVAEVSNALEGDVVCVEGSVEGGLTYHGTGMYVGCNLAFDRETARLAGGFRNEYAGWREDTEFGWRMESYGPCRYDPALQMSHPGRPRSRVDTDIEARLKHEYPTRYAERIVPGTTLGRVNDWLWRRGFWNVVNKVRDVGGVDDVHRVGRRRPSGQHADSRPPGGAVDGHERNEHVGRNVSVGTGGPASVALVVLDTLRKDAFDAHFDWLPGTRFENAYSTSHWTAPAHASLFAGKYPSELGVYAGAQRLDCPEPVLSESFRDSGYTTRAFSANVNISGPFDFHRGFDQFEGSWRLDPLSSNVFDWDGFIAETRDQGPERYLFAVRDVLLGDCDTVPSLKRGALLKLWDLGGGRKPRDDGATEALQFVRDTDFGDDEFLFVNLMEAHAPYAPPEGFRTVEPPELDGLRATLGSPDADPDRIRRAYDDGVRYLADRYRAIFAELREQFDYVITLADHGEALGEYGAWDHLCGLYPEVTRIPLCVWSEEDDAVGTTDRRDEPVSLLDVHRTVLDVAGLDGDSRGRTLLDELDEREWLVEYHGLTDRHRNTLLRDGFDVEPLDVELHGLVAPGYYGWETFDEFHESGEIAKPRERMETLVNELDRRVVTDDASLAPAVERQLRDLGYA